jgi:hypothetical protein
MKSELIEFKCTSDAVKIANNSALILDTMATNTTMLRFKIGPMNPSLRKQVDSILERNRSITQHAVAARIFDIAIALMPALNEVYCMLNIIDYNDDNYYKYVPRAFKDLVLHKVAKKIRSMKQTDYI